MYTWIPFWLTAIAAWHTDATVPGTMEEICLMDTFEAQCPEDHVIVMYSARYGQMQQGRCLPGPVLPESVGCSADVIGQLDGICSGRQTCSVRIPDDRFHDLNVCPPGYMPYLEVSYDCMYVSSSRHDYHECYTDGVVDLSDLSGGIIASSFIFGSYQGAPVCPRVISALPGQRINVTLVDFGTAGNIGHDPTGPSASCRTLYATLVEDSGTDSTPVCGGTQRERPVYLSETNRLEIQFPDSQPTEDRPSFLLRYKVIGCPDPALKGNTLIERTSERAKLQCSATGQRSHLYCYGIQWSGTVANCTAVPGSSTSHNMDIFSGDWDTAEGIGIIVGIGLVLGVIIGVALLLCAILCMYMKRMYKKEDPPPVIYYRYDKAYKGYMPADKDEPSGDELGNMDYNTWRRSIRSGRYIHDWEPAHRDAPVRVLPPLDGDTAGAPSWALPRPDEDSPASASTGAPSWALPRPDEDSPASASTGAPSWALPRPDGDTPVSVNPGAPVRVLPRPEREGAPIRVLPGPPPGPDGDSALVRVHPRPEGDTRVPANTGAPVRVLPPRVDGEGALIRVPPRPDGATPVSTGAPVRVPPRPDGATPVNTGAPVRVPPRPEGATPVNAGAPVRVPPRPEGATPVNTGAPVRVLPRADNDMDSTIPLTDPDPNSKHEEHFYERPI